jgi:hypothetical protein
VELFVEVCQTGNVVSVFLVVGWMTDVGSVDPAFKPRSLAIDGFTDLQYRSTLEARYMSLFSTVTHRLRRDAADDMQV